LIKPKLVETESDIINIITTYYIDALLLTSQSYQKITHINLGYG